jgi:DNA repair protein RadA/Sms
MTKSKKAPAGRISTGFSEFDHVLGGGFVEGHTLLLGGDHGIGKTTLALQVASNLVRKGKKVVYVSADETTTKMAETVKRIGAHKKIKILGNTPSVYEAIDPDGMTDKPDIMIFDEIRSMYLEDVDGDAGTVRQINALATYLTSFANETGVVVMILCHTTKAGKIASSPELDHLVDTAVLLALSDKISTRQLRAKKNRYGKSGIYGLLDFDAKGFHPCKDRS